MKIARLQAIFRSVQHPVEQQAHRILALAVLISGLWFISPLVLKVFQGEHLTWFAQDSWRSALESIGLAQLPRVVISLSLVLMAFGLLARARVAWIFTLVMLTPAIAISVYTNPSVTQPNVIYNTVVYLALLRYGPAFNHSSVAAGTLFALSSVASLLWYAVLGSLYLGQGFAPKILTLPEAIYFAIVVVTTVGFGDIVPVSEAARFFVSSVILLGVTVFASAVGAIITPAAAGAFQKIIQRKTRRLSMKKDHIILCGNTPLALTLYRSLVARGEDLTVIVRPEIEHDYPPEADMLIGDPTNEETLEQAGVRQASHLLAMSADDADNAFIVLAAKAVEGCEAKTVAVVNNSRNLDKVRTVKPDLVFSPQLLSAELLSRVLRGEQFDADLVAQLFVFKPTPSPSDSGHAEAKVPQS